MAPALVAVTEATIVARRLRAPSIYSARLWPDPYAAGGSTAAAAIASLDAGGDAEPPRVTRTAPADPEPRDPENDTGPGGR
jgi:hypothetical protein